VSRFPPAVATTVRTPFGSIVVLLDDSPEAFAAAHLAAALRAPDGSLHLCAVADSGSTTPAGAPPGLIAEQVRRSTATALARAAAATHPTTTALHVGSVVAGAHDEVRRHSATMVAFGVPEERRTGGLHHGSASAVLLREAACSVLVARRSTWPAGRPGRIVVGVDGSPSSARAVRAARLLGERFAARVDLVVAVGGKLDTPDDVRRVHPSAVVDDRPPVDALVAASSGADLVVVGSRGLHGLQALGSVSERVAHRALASVLVVRGLEPAAPSG
jgi:nucleotide-binding universal stress UspA family protein